LLSCVLLTASCLVCYGLYNNSVISTEAGAVPIQGDALTSTVSLDYSEISPRFHIKQRMSGLKMITESIRRVADANLELWDNYAYEW